MVHKKKSIRKKSGVKRITVIRPLLTDDGEDTGLWMDQRIGLFNELRKHGIPTKALF